MFYLLVRIFIILGDDHCHHGHGHGHSHHGHDHHEHGHHDHNHLLSLSSHDTSDASSGSIARIMQGVFLHVLADTLGSVGFLHINRTIW